jgi:hypothetical protein
MEYAEFDAERRRIVRAWRREITDPDELATAVESLRERLPALPGEADQTRAARYLEALDDLVADARTPQSETVWRAADVLVQASQQDGTPAERRVRADAGIAEITRLADTAPTTAERDAALEMNEPLAETLSSLTDTPAPAQKPNPAQQLSPGQDVGTGQADGAGPAGGAGAQGCAVAADAAARFAADPAMAPAGTIKAPRKAPPATRAPAANDQKAQTRDR